MIKSAIIILLLFSVVSCNNKQYFKGKAIKELSKGDFEIPSVYGDLSLFVLVDSNQVAETSIDLLHAVYKYEYQNIYAKFENFVFEVLNQRLILKRGYIEKRNGSIFRLNEKIKLEYEKSGISYFVNHYTENDGKRLEIIRSFLSLSELHTIQYYFFINNYMVTEDDYFGTFYVKPFPF